MLLLQEFDFLAVVLGQHSDFPLAHFGVFGPAGEEDCVCIRADLGLNDILMNQLTHELEGVLLAHIESVRLVKSY